MMNNQEGQFMPPDSDSSQEFVARPINGDFREQEQWQQTPSYQNEKIQPQQTRRRGSKGCLVPGIVSIVLLAALAGGMGMFAYSSTKFVPAFPHGPMVTDQPRTFTTSMHPTLIIHDRAGSIHVHAQQGNTIQVQATHARGPDAQVQYDQSKDQNTVTITVNPDGRSDFPTPNGVDVEVDVPAIADLQLDTSAGDIEVNGVQGQMKLSSKAGSIEARDTILTGTSTLQTEVGDVTFSGNVDPHGTYQLSSNTGTVNATLPANSSVHIDAKTDLGSIDSDFPSINVQDHDVGAEAHGDVGSNPQAKMTLQTHTDSVFIHSGS